MIISERKYLALLVKILSFSIDDFKQNDLLKHVRKFSDFFTIGFAILVIDGGNSDTPRMEICVDIKMSYLDDILSF